MPNLLMRRVHIRGQFDREGDEQQTKINRYRVCEDISYGEKDLHRDDCVTEIWKKRKFCRKFTGY